jgi:hypothetical protein
MMLLSPTPGRMTACQAQLILADSENLLDLGAAAGQLAHLRGRHCHVSGDVVLLVVSDNRLFHRFQFSGRTTGKSTRGGY